MRANKVGKIITYIAIILVLVMGIGLVAKFTNGFTSDFQNFYLTVNGKDVMSSANGYAITPQEPLEVEVKYAFTSDDEENKGYFVKIVPNAIANTDFDFSLDGDVYSYHAEKDLTAGFDIKYGESSFTVTPKGENINEIFEAIYPNYDVSDCIQYAYADMFQLIVTSDNGKSSVVLGFVVTGPVSGIELDKTHIIF